MSFRSSKSLGLEFLLEGFSGSYDFVLSTLVESSGIRGNDRRGGFYAAEWGLK